VGIIASVCGLPNSPSELKFKLRPSWNNIHDAFLTGNAQDTTGRPRPCLPSVDHVIIRLGHFLSSMRATCPQYFNVLFSSFFPNLFVLLVFSLLILRLTFGSLKVLANLLQKSTSVLYIFFPVTRNPVPKRNSKCFLSFYEIFISLYLPKYMHPQSRLFSALVGFLACSVVFIASLHFQEFLKMDPEYPNDQSSLISKSCSVFVFCMSLPTFKYSVLRIFTFKLHN
jgi:hypothetical protein